MVFPFYGLLCVDLCSISLMNCSSYFLFVCYFSILNALRLEVFGTFGLV